MPAKKIRNISTNTEKWRIILGKNGIYERRKIMKSYKSYESSYIGDSDIAALILVGIANGDLQPKVLNFGEDGRYSAYIVDEDAEIGSHYQKQYEFTHWMTIYDDDTCVRTYHAKKIVVYRAGNFGCVIQLIHKK